MPTFYKIDYAKRGDRPQKIPTSIPGGIVASASVNELENAAWRQHDTNDSSCTNQCSQYVVIRSVSTPQIMGEALMRRKQYSNHDAG